MLRLVLNNKFDKGGQVDKQIDKIVGKLMAQDADGSKKDVCILC